MTHLDKEKFLTTVKVPGLRVPKKKIHAKLKSLKPIMLKFRGLNSIGDLSADNPKESTHSLILLDPSKIKRMVTNEEVKIIFNENNFDPDERFEVSPKASGVGEVGGGGDGFRPADPMLSLRREEREKLISALKKKWAGLCIFYNKNC